MAYQDIGLQPSEQDNWILAIHGPVADLMELPAIRQAFSPLPEQPDADEIFWFVADHFSVWNADPRVDRQSLLFGMGFGLCGEQSRVLTALWSFYGFDCRVVSTPSHVLSELKLDDQWVAYDPQHRVIYRDDQRGYSVVELQAMDHWIEGELDPIGYEYDYMLQQLRSGECAYRYPDGLLALPRIAIGPHQIARIRRRSTQPQWHLPLLEYPDTEERSSLLPLYELEIETQHDSAAYQHLLVDLPVIGLAFENQTFGHLDLPAKRYEKSMNASSMLAKIYGTQSDFWLQLGPGAVSRVTYPIAGWAGDRLVQRLDDIGEEAADRGVPFVRQTQPSPPYQIADLDVTRVDQSEWLFTALIELDDSALFDAPAFSVHLERLSSRLPLEIYERVADSHWSFVDALPESPTITLRFRWQGSPYSPPYRDRRHQTFMLRLSGQGLTGGDNYRMIDVWLDDYSDFDFSTTH